MQTLRSAWGEVCGADGRVPAEKLKELLTKAGWASLPTQTSYCIQRGVIKVSTATDNDVVALLRHCGYNERAIGKGGLSVSLAQVEPWWRVQLLGTKAPPNPALTRAVIGVVGAGFHNLPPPSFSCGKSTAGTGPSPIASLLSGAFQVPELPPRPPTAGDRHAAKLRAATHGRPSDPYTAAAEVMAADRSSLLPTSGDTGYLDISGLRHRAKELSRRDTRGSTLLRSARSAGVPYAGGVLMSARDLATTRVYAEVLKAGGAGGGSARPATASAGGLAPLAGAKSTLWEATTGRTNFDGRPGTVRYSGYSVHPTPREQ